jgi:hypothetical protein
LWWTPGGDASVPSKNLQGEGRRYAVRLKGTSSNQGLVVALLIIVAVALALLYVFVLAPGI